MEANNLSTMSLRNKNCATVYDGKTGIYNEVFVNKFSIESILQSNSYNEIRQANTLA